MRPAAVVALSMISSLALAQEVRPPGEVIRNAVSAQITEEGLDAIGLALEEVIPGLIPAGALNLGDQSLGGVGDISNLEVSLSVDRVQLVPDTGELIIAIDAYVGVNSSIEPFEFLLEDPLFGLTICDAEGWIDPFLVEIVAEADIDVITLENDRIFDASVSIEEVQPYLQTSDISLGGGFGCTVLENLIAPLQNVVLNYVEPEIAGALAELEPTLEDALNQAKFNDSLEVLDARLDVAFNPRQVLFSPEGMEILYRGKVSAPKARCIADVDPGGSIMTDTPVPLLSEAPRNSEVIAYVADDLMNQAAYAAFRSGLLCYTVDPNLIDAFPINTSLLSLVGGSGYTDLLGSAAKPLSIKTKPTTVPSIAVGGAGGDLVLGIDTLELNMIGELDYRQARLLGVEVDADVGADLLFDDATGVLDIDLDFSVDSLILTVPEGGVVPGAESEIETGLSNILGGVLEPLLGDLLSGLSFPLPGFEGLGLTELSVGTGGDQGDWIMAEVALGQVDYAQNSSGCGCGGEGDADAGCDSGCDSGGCNSAPAGLGWTLLLGSLVAARRRGRGV